MARVLDEHFPVGSTLNVKSVTKARGFRDQICFKPITNPTVEREEMPVADFISGDGGGGGGGGGGGSSFRREVLDRSLLSDGGVLLLRRPLFGGLLLLGLWRH